MKAVFVSLFLALAASVVSGWEFRTTTNPMDDTGASWVFSDSVQVNDAFTLGKDTISIGFGCPFDNSTPMILLVLYGSSLLDAEYSSSGACRPTARTRRRRRFHTAGDAAVMEPYGDQRSRSEVV